MTADWMLLGNCVVAAMLAAAAIWIVAKGFHALLQRRKVVFAGFLVASAVATIEAQKSTNGVSPNLNSPLPQVMHGGGSLQTGLTGLPGPLPHAPSSSNPVNLVNPVQTTNEDIVRGWRIESVTTNAMFSYAMPSNAVLVGNWHKRGTFGEWMRLELDGFAFPLGTNATAYSSFSVFNDGKMRPVPRDVAHEICAVGVPMLAMPDESRFWLADGAEDSKLLTWEKFFLGGDTNCPVNAQIVLRPNGDFTTRSNDVETVCRRVNPDDWDDDGAPNERDANPTSCEGDFFGAANALPANANPDAYYGLDLSVTGLLGVATIRVTCDGPSDLGDHVIIAMTNQVCHIPLLAGATYAVESGLPIDYSAVSTEYAEIVTNDENHLTVSLPLELAFEKVQMRGGSDSYIAHTSPVDVSPRILNVSGVCCSCVTNETGFSWSCGAECRCAGCMHTLDCLALWDGYSRLLPSELRCSCANEDQDENGAGVNIAFDHAAVVFENQYTNAPGAVVSRRSTATTLICRVMGGQYGGNVSVSLSNGAKLLWASGDALPGSATAAAGDEIVLSAVFEGQAESDVVGDVVATAVFTENMTGRQLTNETTVTVARVELRPQATIDGLEFRHQIGVGEWILCQVYPQAVSWDAVAIKNGSVTNFWGQTWFMCPLESESNGVRFNIQGALGYLPEMQVIEPSGVSVTRAREMIFVDAVTNQAGWVGMTLEIHILPPNVSFMAIQAVEVPEYGGGIAPTGYFADDCFSSIWHHTERMGAGSWHAIRSENYFMMDEAKCGEGLPGGWSGGQITWRIPLAWGYVPDDEETHFSKEFGEPYFQIFTMEANGNLRVEKLGHWVERSPDGTRHRSTNTEEGP